MGATQQDLKTLVCVGEIAAPHGVKGGLKVRSFTSPPARLFSYALQTEQGKPLLLVQRGADPKPEMFIAELADVRSREGADALRGTKLYTERASLPPAAEGEYYLVDLIGPRVRTEDGADCGRIVAIHDYGAGDMLEIRQSKELSFMLPFDDDCVPVVDIEGGIVTIIMPVEVAGEPDRGDSK